MERSTQPQIGLIIIVAMVAFLALCAACGVVAFAVGMLGFLTAPVISQPIPSSTDPINPDRALYLEIADEQLRTLEGGSDRVRELLTDSAAGTITVGSDDWIDKALIAENWIDNGHDVMISVNPPPELTDLHAIVMEAATTCYVLSDAVYDATTAQLENLHEHTTACAQAIDTAQEALAAEVP